mgnify:CR=1 FL=1
MIVDYDNQEIKGIIFKDSYTVGRKYYTRLEYHRFVETTVDGVTTYPYYVSNRAYVSKSPQSIGNKIDLKQTKWLISWQIRHRFSRQTEKSWTDRFSEFYGRHRRTM